METTALQFFVWQDYYELGVPEVDAEHRRIFEIAGRLHSGMTDRRRADVAAVLAELHTAVEAHFATEERLMEEAQFPGTVQHTAEHAQFLDGLARDRAEIEAGRSELTPGALKAFNEWVTAHLCGADAVMCAFLRGK